MKKYCIYVLIIIFGNTFAQKTTKIGYIDMEYILTKVPEYAEAKNLLDQKANTWKNEIETKKAGIVKLKDALSAEKVLLTKELIAEKEEEITFLEKELSDYQQKRFGPQGDLVIQKSALIQPIQDQVFNIVQDYAAKQKYDFIFDKSSDLTMIYSNERFDVSDQILKALERAGRKVELTKKQQKIQDEKDQREIDVKENPEILDKEKAKEEKNAQKAKDFEDRKAAIAAKKQELKEKNDAIKADREAKRQKLLEEQKTKREELLKKQQEKKDNLKNKTKTN
jgi:Skp family chaperone for outer membrane proteins